MLYSALRVVLESDIAGGLYDKGMCGVESTKVHQLQDHGGEQRRRTALRELRSLPLPKDEM